MPYSSTRELPAEVKQKYTSKQQRAFMKAFNDAKGRGESEEKAFKIAHAAARRAGKSDKASDEARSFSAKRRKELAKDGKAMSDGSFPIVNKADLRNAIAAYGRASNKAAAKRHIKKRARALGATEMLPDDWKNGDSAMSDAASDSFSDTMTALRRAVREQLGRRTYLVDASSEWLVYERYDEEAGEYVMYRRSYSGADGSVTLGDDASEVLRKTVYVPVSKQDAASALVEIWGATFATHFAGPTREDVAKEGQKSDYPKKQGTKADVFICPTCKAEFQRDADVKLHRKNKSH